MEHLRHWGVPLIAVLLLASSQMQRTLAPADDPPPLPAAPRAGVSAPTPADMLAQRRLVVPVQGIPRAKLKDTFHDGRGKGRRHKAIDIMAPHGTPVLAADDGKIAKISSNGGGGLSIYQQDASGRFVYYYAHLAGYADGLREGQAVRRGDVIGYVGSSGNAPESAPHLHFAVLVLQNKRLWGGEALNPYWALAHGRAVEAHAAVR